MARRPLLTRLLQHRVAFAFATVVSVVVVGVLGYYAIGGGRWRLFGCVYTTVTIVCGGGSKLRIVNPSPDHLVAPGAVPIVLGEPDQVRRATGVGLPA